jgi:hypothetical protein
MRVHLSTAEAENLLATIWIALEKHGLTSPNMRILSRDTKLKLELKFGSRHDENLVKAELPRAMVMTMQGLSAISLRRDPPHGVSARGRSRSRSRRIGRRLAG